MSSPDNVSSGNNTAGDQNNSSLNLMNMGTFLKAFGSISSGYSDYQSIQSKGAADKFNANIATQNAALTASESASNEAALRLRQQQEVGQQRANAAEAGTGPISEGSTGEAIRQSEINANFQALSERYKGTVQRTKFQNDANLSNYYAKIAKKNSQQSMLNTGLSTTAQLLSGYGRYQQGQL